VSKRLAKLGIRAFEESAFILQTFSLPKLGNKQDKAVRQIYKSSNVLRKRAGFEQKKYLMLNQKGILEEVS
jgi:hypothetical protein